MPQITNMPLDAAISDDSTNLIEQYLLECDFSDECDKCGNPNKERSYAKMSSWPEEVDFYLCKTCALKYANEQKEQMWLNEERF